MESLLIVGAVGLALAVVGFGVALWTRDRRVIAISISLLGIAILLYISQWQANDVRYSLHYDIVDRAEIALKLDAIKLLLKMALER